VKNKLTAEQWKARKEIVSTDHYGEVRGIAHKSAAVHGEGKFNVRRAPRHIANRKAGDGLSNHARLLLNKKA